jgi:hypothetical protein
LTSIRVKISRITAKKVPALTLIVVGLVGMVAGVLAATITVTQNSYNGETGTYHNNTGNVVITDQGLSIVSDVTGISANTTATIGGTGSNKNLFNGSTFTTGHWMETIVISDTADSAAHTVTIKIQNGGTPPNGGTALAGGTVTLTITATGTTGTITDYIDLGVSSITAPLTVYANAT